MRLIPDGGARVKALLAAVAVYTIGASRGHLHAQTAANIPIRTLAPSTAVSKDSVGPVLAVRALSNGNVLVNDDAGRRVVLFDANLGQSKVVIDTIGGTGPDAPMKVALPASTLIRYLGDSSLYADRLGNALLVLDVNGKLARVMSVPRPGDVTWLAGGTGGHPAFDRKGRLVYRGLYRQQPLKVDPARPWLPSIPVLADSAPIVRADLDARTADTIATLKTNLGISFDKLEFDKDGNVTIWEWADPFDVDDQWAMLSDGTIAILSVHDYHIEWLDPDGAHRSSPKMPFDWKKLTEADQQRMIDSLRPQLDQLNGSIGPRTINTPSGPRRARQQFEFLPLNKLSDFEQPIESGAVKADLDGRLWILPKTSLSAKGGLLYDVINRKGEIVERVQFPMGYVLGGFGEHEVLYVVHINGKKGTLEQTTVK
jgi:hypothetical protein